ncbi:hypothetical protein C900_02519 [Fulvivirga imtechensis AK7]|uniref:Activator of Hsp90 ATPase homologue 1/2-like C-terminal domain-containing protein n=1 Tax=Fulvivirga imtechensis AK7 TaxID=1237149 RepID=L8JVG6_9BACT|nr:SRPBCC domain-containing protein [Fulvivirga imtechensis]ELR71604.1 hypothetical protein C900_02519 [Fulvivirga imtechensis AK7]
MENELIVKGEIIIDAEPGKVWNTLTSPERTKQYMFGCEVLSDWKVGSPVLWKGVFDGKEIVAVKGEVKAIEPCQYLAYTTIDPNADIEDIPENYTTVTYRLTSENGNTRLNITQGDFAKVANGEKRYQDTQSEGGWDGILKEIKKVAERG